MLYTSTGHLRWLQTLKQSVPTSLPINSTPCQKEKNSNINTFVTLCVFPFFLMVTGVLYKQTAIAARITFLRVARLLQNSVTNVVSIDSYEA